MRRISLLQKFHETDIRSLLFRLRLPKSLLCVVLSRRVRRLTRLHVRRLRQISEMSGLLLPTLPRKRDVDTIIRDTLDKVLVLRFGRASDPICLQLDDILLKTAHEVSKFATIALVDIDSEEIQVYVKYFDISLIPSTIFFFNAHHMKMDSGTADHTKWIGAFHRKQDFIDVVEAIYRGAMKGKLIVSCPLPPERIPKFQLLFKNL